MNINRISHIMDSMDELEEWAGNGATSIEIAYAIVEIATDLSDVMMIWGAPNEEQLAAVTKKAWSLADVDEDVLYWGSETLSREL